MTSSSHRLSDKLTAIALLFMLVALAAVGITLYVAWQLEGGAAAVNAMGSQRMRSYHIGMLLAERAARPAGAAELSAAVRAQTMAFQSTLTTLAAGDPARPLIMPKTAPIQERFLALQARWARVMDPAIESLLTAPDPQTRVQMLSAYRAATEAFVQEIDDLVLAMEHEISSKTALLRVLQYGLIALSVAGTVALIYLMFLLIVRPVTRLEEGMRQMEAGDFDVRLPVETRDEFGVAGDRFQSDGRALVRSVQHPGTSGRRQDPLARGQERGAGRPSTRSLPCSLNPAPHRTCAASSSESWARGWARAPAPCA